MRAEAWSQINLESQSYLNQIIGLAASYFMGNPDGIHDTKNLTLWRLYATGRKLAYDTSRIETTQTGR